MSTPTRPITPDTRVAELLDEWPELEPVLMAQSPAFQKLRNPVLRRTIARVATLQQAAALAGISARDLVIALRRAAGQAVDDVAATVARSERPPSSACGGTAPLQPVSSPRLEPDGGAAVDTIDADALLEAGEVPIKPVMDAARRLNGGECLRVIVSFPPVPLIDRLESHGFRCDTRPAGGGRLVVTIRRA
jgi:hypothetical protein